MLKSVLAQGVIDVSRGITLKINTVWKSAKALIFLGVHRDVLEPAQVRIPHLPLKTPLCRTGET